MQSHRHALKVLHEHEGHFSIYLPEAALEKVQPKRKNWPAVKAAYESLEIEVYVHSLYQMEGLKSEMLLLKKKKESGERGWGG